jgi:hypothetical protein
MKSEKSVIPESEPGHDLHLTLGFRNLKREPEVS